MRIDQITVGERYRRDLGDLEGLQASIVAEGLIQPIVVTKDGRLVAGQRRLEACRALGRTDVPVHVVRNRDDAAGLLRKERDENTCRKDMLPSELAALGRALEELERPKAEERQRDGQARGRAAQRGDLVEGTRTPNQKTAEVVGDALGISGSNYHRAKTLVTAAEAGDEKAAEAVAEMDRTGRITPAYNRYKGRTSAPSGRNGKRPEPDLVAPASKKKDRATVAARRAKIAELADQGWLSDQIADELGYSDARVVRQIARDGGIEIRADKQLGRTRNRVLDHHRIAFNIVSDLEATEMSLERLDVTQIDDLSEVDYWVTVLNKSVKSLRKLSRQLSNLALTKEEVTQQ